MSSRSRLVQMLACSIALFALAAVPAQASSRINREFKADAHASAF
jgi:hypothetical protein